MKVSSNGNTVTLAPDIIVHNVQAYPNKNVKVTFTIPSGLVYSESTPSQGVYNPNTKIWTIGTIQGNKTVSLKNFKLTVTNINAAPFTVTAVVSGDSDDSNPQDNTYSWVIETDTCAPAAGAQAYTSSCLCGSVYDSTTLCTKGSTEWRLNTESVVNGEVMSWNILTGDHAFKYIDNSKNITFTWDLYCVNGVNEYLIQQNIPGVIRASVGDKKAYDHTFVMKECGELSIDQITFIQTAYPALVLCDYCWELMLNGDSQVTYAKPMNCDPAKNTKTTHEKLEVAYNPSIPTLGITLPEDPEISDIHIVTYIDAIVYFTYNGISWVQSVNHFVVPESLNITGIEPNRKIVLTLTNGTIIESNTF